MNNRKLWVAKLFSLRLFLFAEFFVKDSSEPFRTPFTTLGELFIKGFSFFLVNKENELFLGLSEFTKILSATFIGH